MDTRVTAIAARSNTLEAQLRSRDETARRLGLFTPPNYFVNRAISSVGETNPERTLRWRLFGEKSLKDERLDAARLVALDTITNSLIEAEAEQEPLLTLIDRMANGFTDLFPYAGIAIEFRRDILDKSYTPAEPQNFPNLSQSQPSLISQITREPSSVEEVEQKMLGLPLLDRKRNLLGIVALSLEAGHAGFPQGIIGYAEKLCEKSARMLENIATKEKLLAEVATDDLTGLKNRKHFDEALVKAHALSERHGKPLSLLFFDIDHFKQINDQFGHQTGNMVLKAFAQLVSDEIRQDDTLARWGGEEFALIAPETKIEAAKILAERIREAVEKHPFVTDKGETIQVTVSIGVATLNPNDTPLDLLAVADQNLYLAKNTGRNKVV